MRSAILLLGSAALVAVPAIAVAQGARVLDPRYVQEAAQQHPELVQEFGGAETGARAAYVDSVGRRVANTSGIPASAYRFTVLNSAVENAFAVPGGYVYITRQLMTLMDNEAELAFALGHEVGHIAANHAQARKSVSSRNSVLGVLGAVLGSVVGGGVGDILAGLAQTQSQAALLSFSRDQEYQADTLGTRYLISSGYDPVGGPGILAALTRSTALEARIQGRDSRQLPEWASTHPLSENRVQRARVDAQRTGRLGQGIVNRDQFLSQLDGMYVDDDPLQGIIDGRTFTHPDLRIYFAVPQGYLMQNGTRAVTIQGSAGKAQFSGGTYRGPIENYIQLVIQQLAGRTRVAIPPPQRTVINGLPAAYTTARANTSSGPIDVSVVAYQWDQDTIYHLIMLTRGGYGIGPFQSVVQSVRKISPAEASQIRPRVIDVVTVRPGDTVQSLAGRMAYRNFQIDRFIALNGIASNSRLVPGQKVKVVVYGARRG